MKLDIEEIKKLPITTNRIEVLVDKERFFSKFSIVSYYSQDRNKKNLAYEQLSETPFISVTGLRARWDNTLMYPTTRFFVLSEKSRTEDVLSSLRTFDDIVFKMDSLDEYADALQMRVLSSLAINSLGRKKQGKMMYSNGSLLICDDQNFYVPKSRKELVCLKIEVNEYLNITAKTTSFSNPINIEQLQKYGDCVFQVGKDIHGQWFSGQAVKPVVIKRIPKRELDLRMLFVQKKKFDNNHNIVPYWPINPEKYTHGRLFAICQVVESANYAFDGILHISFADSPIEHFDTYLSGKDMLCYLNDYFKGRSIYIEDPFRSSVSAALVKQIGNKIQEILGSSITLSSSLKEDDLIIKLCEPKDANMIETHYAKSMKRLLYANNPIQHLIYDTEAEEELSTTKVRRILMELLVKDCLIKREFPDFLIQNISGWTFYRYKINKGFVLGAMLKAGKFGKIDISDFGFNQLPIPFETFAFEKLRFQAPFKIKGFKDYMALEKNGNVFLIIDTDEIPILDVSLIDEAYGKIVNEDVTLSLFKRKAEAHKYLRGYMGFHLWKTDGLDGEHHGSYTYISGFNSENLKFFPSSKMDKMPHARRIFVLHAENPNEIESLVMEICGMLKFGFGRWNEIMTYPFPFKFLQEYLDDTSETAFSKHWSEINYRGDLYK